LPAPLRCDVHRLREFEIEGASKAPSDLALRFREVGVIGLEAICPKVGTGLGVDQLHVHPNLVAGPPNAALKDIANAERTTDLPHVNGFVL